MKTIHIEALKKYLPRIVLIVSLLSLYLYTLAPGLTWANGGSDGGELITAAATGGVAHPSGYPLYLVLARLFQYLPMGTLAFRTNLMSAVFTVLAALLVFSIVRRSVSQQIQQPWLAGMVSAYAFGLAPLIWSQAVITEVYALQSFLIALIIYLYVVPIAAFDSKPNQLDRWRGLSLGLAISNHVTAVLFLPVGLLLGSVQRSKNVDGDIQSRNSSLRGLKLHPASLGRQLFWFAIGLSPYLLLPVRALTNPPINWGNPVTVARFWWLVTGRLYQSYYLHTTLPEVWAHLQAGASLTFGQFGILGVALGVIGLIIFGLPSRLNLLTIWIACGYSAFAVLYRSADSYVYMIPVFLCFAIWIGAGIAGLMVSIKAAALVRLSFGLLMILYFTLHALTSYNDVDASHDLRAQSFGRETLAVAPENAIIFAKGDQAIFALWYFHFALRERPDVAVLAVDLLHFDWYQENLHATYPSLEVAGPFPWPETITRANPSRPVCYVQYIDKTVMECSEALLTP